MKQFIIKSIGALVIFAIFAVTFFFVYAASFVLDGLGSPCFAGVFALFMGLVFFAVIIWHVIDAACTR